MDEDEIMSRTKRIYNRKLKKAQRYNIHSSGYDNNGVRINNVGIPFTFRSFLCMGHCRIHRKNPGLDQKTLRKKRKEQFRFDLRNESKYQEEEEYIQEPEYDPYILAHHLKIEEEYSDSLEKIGVDAARNIYEMMKIYDKHD